MAGTQTQPSGRYGDTTTHAVARPVVRIDPRALVGLDEEQIRSVLGNPGTVREQAPSRIWRYAAGSCSLDLFFYLDLGSSKFRALTYTVGTPKKSGPREAPDICVGRIRTQNMGQATKS
jgi:hypothetical protein